MEHMMSCLIKYGELEKSCAEERSPCITLFRFLKGTTRFGPCKKGLGLWAFSVWIEGSGCSAVLVSWSFMHLANGQNFSC
jgi:hypothetical protein